MFFYGMAAALNYAQDRRAALGLWRCSAGHEVGPSANFCETYGVPVNGGKVR